MDDIKELKQAIEVLKDLLILERSKGNIKEALDRARRIRDLAEKLVELDDSPESEKILEDSRNQEKELEQIYRALEEKIKKDHVDEEVLKQVGEMLEGAQSFTKSGDIAFLSGELSEALFFYENAHEFNYLAVKLFSNYETLRELESIQRKLALLYKETGDFEKARNLYMINAQICNDLLRELENEEVYDDLAYNLTAYADLVYKDDPHGGQELYDESLSCRREAVERFQTVKALEHLIIDLITLARTMQKTGKKDQALEYYEECQPALVNFLRLNPGNTKMQQALLAVEDQIEKLRG